MPDSWARVVGWWVNRVVERRRGEWGRAQGGPTGATGCGGCIPSTCSRYKAFWSSPSALTFALVMQQAWTERWSSSAIYVARSADWDG